MISAELKPDLQGVRYFSLVVESKNILIMLTITNKGCNDNPQEISEQLRTQVRLLNYSSFIYFYKCPLNNVFYRNHHHEINYTFVITLRKAENMHTMKIQIKCLYIMFPINWKHSSSYNDQSKFKS